MTVIDEIDDMHRSTRHLDRHGTLIHDENAPGTIGRPGFTVAGKTPAAGLAHRPGDAPRRFPQAFLINE